MRTRAPDRIAVAALAALALCGCQTLSARLPGNPFHREPALTLERTADLRPPEGLRVTGSEDRQIDLAWDPVLVGGIAGYAVLRADDPVRGFELVGRTGSRFDTVYADRGESDDQLGDGRTYHYRIHPHDHEGRVSRSHAYISATTEGEPDVPTGVRTYSNLPRRIVVVWDPNEPRATTGYTVLRSPTEAGPFEPVGLVEGRVTTIYEDPVPGDLRVMYYRVAARNRFGGEGEASEPVRGVTKAEPLPPIGLAVAERRLGSIGVRWATNVEPDLSGYEVWRAERDDDGWDGERLVGEVGAGGTLFRDPEVGCGQSLRYRVRALDRDGLTSGYSDPLDATGEAIDLRARPLPGAVELRWSPARAWPAAQIFAVRMGLPDRLLDTVRGQTRVRIDDLPPGRHQLAVVLTTQPADGADGADGAADPVDAPACEIEVEVPAP